MQPGLPGDVRLYAVTARPGAVLSTALRGRKSEKRERPRTTAATPLRPDRLPMRCVQGLAISSGTLASASGCRPKSTSVPTVERRRARDQRARHLCCRESRQRTGYSPIPIPIPAWTGPPRAMPAPATRSPRRAATPPRAGARAAPSGPNSSATGAPCRPASPRKPPRMPPAAPRARNEPAEPEPGEPGRTRSPEDGSDVPVYSMRRWGAWT